MRRSLLAAAFVVVLTACGSDDPSTVATEGDGDRPGSTTSLTIDDATTVPPPSSTTMTTVDPDTPVSDREDEPPSTTPGPTTTSTATPAPPHGGGTVDPRKHSWDSAEVLIDGQTVRVTYYAGVCDQLDRVDVAKSSDAVTITLWVGRKPDAQEACIELAEERTVDVAVGEPVGGREIRDGADA